MIWGLPHHWLVAGWEFVDFGGVAVAVCAGCVADDDRFGVWNVRA